MNTQAQVASHSADTLPDVQPLHAALADLREDLQRRSPGSLQLFDMFAPRLLAWANNPNALTSRVWLDARWKAFFFQRVAQLSADLNVSDANPKSAGSLTGAQFRAQLRELLRAYVKHVAGRHPLLAKTVSALGSLGFYVFLGALFMACQVMGLDLGDRLQAFWAR